MVAFTVVLAHINLQIRHPAGMLLFGSERSRTQTVGGGAQYPLRSVGYNAADPLGQQRAVRSRCPAGVYVCRRCCQDAGRRLQGKIG